MASGSKKTRIGIDSPGGGVIRGQIGEG